MRTPTAIASVAFLTAAGLTSAAEPQTLPGYYTGASLGSAAAHTSVAASEAWGAMVDSSTTGWSLFAGYRPKKYFGFELGYIDFGKSKLDNVSDGTADIIYEATAKNYAFAGYLVGYLPLGSGSWDLFAKAGYARLTTQTYSSYNLPNICVGNPCSIVGASSTSTSSTTGDFAYGIGAQYRYGSVTFRGEYQQIDGTQTNPDMFSLGVAWNF